MDSDELKIALVNTSGKKFKNCVLFEECCVAQLLAHFENQVLEIGFFHSQMTTRHRNLLFLNSKKGHILLTSSFSTILIK